MLRIWTVLALTGCSFTWGSPMSKIQRTVESSSTAIQRDTFRGKAELLADGTFQFTFAGDPMCAQTEVVTEQATVTRHKQFSSTGRVLLGLQIVSVVVGVALFVNVAGEPDPPPGEMLSGGALAKIIVGSLATIGGALGVGFTVTNRFSSIGGNYPRHRTAVEPAIKKPAATTTIKCPSELVGPVVLVTPWGEEFAARTTHALQSTFTPGWNVDIDPTLAAGRSKLAGPWKITSSQHGELVTHQLSDAELARAVDVISKYKNRVIVGGTPANLTTTGLAILEGALTAGKAATLNLTITNNGASSARDVKVTTRSSQPQLHGVVFAFGVVQPGTRATRSKTITLPPDTTVDSATVLLVFSEAGGHAPTDITQQLKIARSLCPTGKLTRADYAKKRAKLQKAVDDGTMSQDEFNKLDTELLRCLE